MLFKRRIKDLRSGDPTLRKVIEHINYAEDALEERHTELTKTLEKLSKRVADLESAAETSEV